MLKYQPYRDNPKSVKHWLTSHMALKYNWQMMQLCLGVLIPTVLLFHIELSSLTKIQNLLFHSSIFSLAIILITGLSCWYRPSFVSFKDLFKFTKGKMTMPSWGDAVDWLYFMLNFDHEEMAEKQAQSKRTPIELLQNMEDQKLAEDTYRLIEQEGGLKPRIIEPICIGLLFILIVSQWFFVQCLVTQSGALVYEPAWVRSFLDWFMMNQVTYRPIESLEINRGLFLLHLENEKYLNEINTLQDAVVYPLFRSSVVYHIWLIWTMLIINICSFIILYYRKGVLAYDKVTPYYASNCKLIRYIYVFFLTFLSLGFSLGIVWIVDFISLPSVSINSPQPTYIFEFFFTFFNLLTFYIFTDFLIGSYHRFFTDPKK